MVKCMPQQGPSQLTGSITKSESQSTMMSPESTWQDKWAKYIPNMNAVLCIDQKLHKCVYRCKERQTDEQTDLI